MLRLLLIAAATGLWIVGCDHEPIQSQVARGAVGGHVISVHTEQPIAGVKITCGGQTAYTNDQGRYYLCNIEKGVHDLFGKKESYHDYAIGLYVSTSTTHDFSMARTDFYGSLSGRVRLGSSDVPVAGAAVTCNNETVTSGADGYYSIDSIPRETYALKVIKNHYLQYTAWVTIDTDVVYDVRMASSIVSGRVTNFIDGPVPGVTVRVESSTTITDSEGYFRLDPVPQGTHTISFSHPEYLYRSCEITIPSTELKHDATIERLITDTLFVAQDATVSMADFADCDDCPTWGSSTTNYGNESRLRLEFFLRAKDGLPPEAYIGRSRFLVRLPSLPEYVTTSDLTYARFRMIPTGEASQAGFVTARRLSSENAWSESQITWQTLPEVNPLSYSTGPADADESYELDVLPVYTDPLDNSRGLLFQKEETGAAAEMEYINFWSSEAPDMLNRPCVIVRFVR